MRKYEMLAILSAETDNQEEESERISGVINNLGGNVLKKDLWGKRQFAYPINKKTEGFYVLFDFELEPSQTFELRRVLGLRPNIYRQLVTVQE